MKTMIFDTETTDLTQNIGVPLDKQPDIIEFFGLGLEVNDQNELVEFSTLGQLIKPRKPVTPEITRITNITNVMLSGKEPFKFYAPEIKAYIEGFDQAVAHNAAFDKDIVDFEFGRLQINIKWPELICTVEQTLWIKGYRLKLGGLYQELFGEDFADKHRAENDVRALTRCFIELRRRDWL